LSNHVNASMSSRFFTWTKGDRRYTTDATRPSGVVPIPAECISIKGMDYAREAKASMTTSSHTGQQLTLSQGLKANRRPLPLAFDQSSRTTSERVNRSSGSIALHDAAVQSATHLMAVVNDMLQSPQISAHISAQRRSGLTPMHGRPRSRTAPSTPLVEAPGASPVELPGSLLAGKKSISSFHHSIDGKTAYGALQTPTNAALGSAILRPHSSPQHATHGAFATPRQSSDGFWHPGGGYPPAQAPLPSASPTRMAHTMESSISRPNHSSDRALVTHDAGHSMAPSKRPSLSLLQPAHPTRLSDENNVSHSTSGSSDSETVLLEQISRMRSSHEAHLASVREAHLRELDSHRSYISFLEHRRTLPEPAVDPLRRPLTLDTSHTGSQSTELRSADASATTHQSFDSLEIQRRASQEASAEASALKRKLSLAQRAQSESGEVRRDRDRLRLEVERGERRVMQLKDIVRKAKESEKSLRNAIADLEARLVEANNARADVLEGFHEAVERVRKAAGREEGMGGEIRELRERLFYFTGRRGLDTELALPGTDVLSRPEHGRTKSDVVALTQGDGPLAQQHSELRQVAVPQNYKIRQLEERVVRHQATHDTVHGNAATSDRVSELEASLSGQATMLAAAREECVRLNAVLHEELRRQSRAAAQKSLDSLAAVDGVGAEELAEATRKAYSIAQPTADSSPAITITTLERELAYCLREIVLYKLDVRGYKKDLKRLQTQLAEAKAGGVRRPPTPDRDSLSSTGTRSDASSTNQTHEIPVLANPNPSGDLEGLGISLPPRPHTPTRSLATATARALLLATPPPPPPPPPIPTSSPQPTGPRLHKRLPRPPASRSPSPLPHALSGLALQRDGTVRSLSESIVSSYAKRSSSEGGGSLLTTHSIGVPSESSGAEC
ncbi:hypothetical protein LTR53_017092, partial [Teratosphaeriaceae sp. CCFEE 6253]